MNREDLEGEFLQYASIVKLTEGQEMTPADLSAAITALRAGVDVFKGVEDLNTNVANLELDRAIHSMDRALFELEKELLAKEKENESLKKQLASINKRKVVEQLIAKDSLWFVKDDNSQLPVCRSCTDKENRFVYMSKSDMIPTGVLSGKEYKCHECKILISVLDEIVYSPSFIVH